jgi:hypothetical protein
LIERNETGKDSDQGSDGEIMEKDAILSMST